MPPGCLDSWGRSGLRAERPRPPDSKIQQLRLKGRCLGKVIQMGVRTPARESPKPGEVRGPHPSYCFSKTATSCVVPPCAVFNAVDKVSTLPFPDTVRVE
jgi:hypothetical protein